MNRIAYRAFTQNPELPFDDFKQLLGKAMFGDSAAPQTAEDLLFLQESFFMNRSWFSASPLVSPVLLKGKLEMGALSTERLSDYNRRLDRIAQIAANYSGWPGAAGELGRVAQWITDNWNGERRNLLSDHLRQ